MMKISLPASRETLEKSMGLLGRQVGDHFSSAAYVVMVSESEMEFVEQILLMKELCREGRGCGTCEGCRIAEEASHPSLRRIQPDGRSIKIEQIRNLHRTLETRDLSDGRTVVCIREADRLVEEAANALLKILEEPPSYVVFFLLTARPALLLPTILSRCQMIRFPGSGLAEGQAEARRSAEGLIGILDRISGWQEFGAILKFIRSEKNLKTREEVTDMADFLLQEYRSRWRGGRSEAVRSIEHVDWLKSQMAKNMNISLGLTLFCLKVTEGRFGCLSTLGRES